MAKLFAAAVATAEAGTLAVTWEDCGAQHAKVNSLTPSSIETGATTTLVGEGIVDEDVTSASFAAVVKAAGVQVASCSGDGTADIECKLPLGAGVITVKALSFPLAKGDVKIPVDVKVSSIIPPSLAKTDTHISATEQNGDSVICLDVHTAKQELEEATVATAEAGTLAVTWEDCGAQHAKVNSLTPSTIQTGATTTLVGEGTVDEDVTSANFAAVVKAAGVQVASCSGDGTADIDCKLPLGAGVITVKALSFPLAKGDVKIPVDVKVSSIIPPSLAKTDTHISATEQNGDSVICLDVHTAKQELKEAVTGATLAVTYADCGDASTHAKVTDLQPSSITTGGTTTITGTGDLDEDVDGAQFAIDIKAGGVTIKSCSGDASSDVECKLPLGVGSLTLKALSFPLKAGSVSIPVDTKLSALIPPSLAKTSNHITATGNNGDKLFCLDVNTEKQDLQSGDLPDCSTATCPKNCQCGEDNCADETSACLAAPNCASSQTCAFACNCGDDACLLKCAAASPSIKALPLAKCIISKCNGAAIEV